MLPPLSPGWPRVASRRALASAILLVATSGPKTAWAGEDTHEYADGEKVVVWTSGAGPYNNPQEMYKFADLGLCELVGSDIEAQIQTQEKGELLESLSLVSSPRMQLRFGAATVLSPVCGFVLSEAQASSLSDMVQDDYWYKLYVDDLPLWAFLGEHSKFEVDVSRLSKLLQASNRSRAAAPRPGVVSAPPVPKALKGKPLPKVFTHRHFTFFRNGNQIIEIDMEASNPWPIYARAPLNFSYSASWYTTTKEFADRTARYLDPKFFEHKVHWFSIVNSFVLCFFLCMVVAVILMKTLKRDFTRYAMSDLDEFEAVGGGDDGGWKQVGGDVFRRPERLVAFTTLYATGVHLGCAVLFVLSFAMFNSYYRGGGANGTSMIVSYLATVMAGGYEGGRVFRMYGGRQWKRAMVFQCLFLPAVAFIAFALIDITAVLYGAAMTVPLKTGLLIVVLFVIICMPLHALGTLLGRRAAVGRSLPCRVHHLKRPVPAKHWLLVPLMLAAAGLVPFGCLFIELYFVMTAVWSHNKIYYVYGFMFAILLLLCCVIVCVSITCTYVLLSAEDYRWQWQSFLSCSTTAGYVFLYIVYYFYNSTQMSGFFQTLYYFTTSILFCISFGVFCGALGFVGSSKFVLLIYSNIKVE